MATRRRGNCRRAGDVPYLFEPDEETVLGELLPHSLNFKIYQILLEARASEHSARMVAMRTPPTTRNS